ncbi:MAG: trypsin-like peptidase domain-containing protein, partial [Desulfobacterales bacterium]|nr:trypsin-like peptidase domain-containing protein [Desulfobacterales bacterium]
GIPKGTGSGTIISTTPEGGFVLTAAHVCLMSNQYEDIYVRDMKGGRSPSVIVRVDKKRDMCVLYVSELTGKAVTVAMMAPKAGDEVFSISSPYGAESIGDGMVPVIRGTYGGKYTPSSVPDVVWDIYHLRIAPGSSGGMIVNRHGHMVGMTHRVMILNGHIMNYTDLSMGVQYEDLKEFMKPYR